MLYRSPWLAPISLALRNMRMRLGRTMLTSLGISLGVAVVLAIQITNKSTLDSINQVFDRAAGQANLLVVPDSLLNGTGESLDERLLTTMQNVENVEVASPTLRTKSLLASEAKEWQVEFGVAGLSSGNVLDIYGMLPLVDPLLRVYALAEGRLPLDGKFEVVIPIEFSDEKKLGIGDDLVILIPDGVASLEIVGLLDSEGVALLNSGVVAFAPLEVVQDLFSRRGEVDEIALKISPELASDVDALDQFKIELEESAGRAARVIYPAARGQLVARMLGTYQQGLSFFSLIAIFVGTFLIYNTFSMTVVERTREIGMMRAIGMSRWNVLVLVLVEAAILSIIGSVIGLVMGVLLARGLMVAMGALIAVGEGVLTIPANGLLQSLGVGVVVTLTAAMLPAIQAARISPLEALRVQARVGEKIKPIVWVSGLVLIFVGIAAIYGLEFRPEVRFNVTFINVLFILLGATLTVPLVVARLEGATQPLAVWLYGNEGRIGSSNIQRSIGRTTLTVASLIVSLAMIVGIMSLSASFESDFSSWIDASLGGDLYVHSPVGMRESFGHQLESVPGVAAASPVKILIVRIAQRSLPPEVGDDDTIFYNAIEPESFRKVGHMEFVTGQGDIEENWVALTSGKAVFISSIVAEAYSLEKGDTLYLQTRRGEQPFFVAGVVVDFFAQGQTITGTYDDLRMWFGESGVNRYTLSVNPDASVDAVVAEIEARYKDRNSISVQTSQAMKIQIEELLDQSLSLFDVLSLIGVVIGSLGVINTLTMNVIERKREIGGLRSLGMTRNQIVRMVLAEALGLGVMGAIYGLVFGFIFSQVMITEMNNSNGYDLNYIFTLEPFVTGLVLALGISQLAALLPARRGARLNIVEAIKHE
ncbi:MAG: ABC transporter permease [Chloroflexi bacterium]|nr:ABC transporter permease [Chloroflexota bacterium]